MLKEYISSGENMASSLLAGAAGVVPLALLAYKGVNSLNSSTPLVSPIRQETSSSIMGDALGKAARAKQVEQEKKLLDKTEAIKKKFTDGTAKSTWMDRVRRSADARARNLQTFATFLQDPNLELTDIQKNKLTALISSAVADENLDLEPLWDEVIDPLIKQNNTELLSEFERVRRSYGKIGNLVPTTKAMVPESPLQSIRIEDDKNEAGKMLGKIRQKLGNNYSVEGHMLSIGDQQVPVARIYSRGKKGQNFETLMPLSNSPFFAAGEQFQTIKSAPKYVVDARRAANLVRSVNTLDELVQRGGAVGLHQYAFDLLDEFQEDNGRFNLRKFRQAQEELLIGVSRGIANDSELAKHIAYQAESKSSRMITVGLSRMSTDAALRIQTDLAKLNGVDPAGAGEKRILEGHGEGRRGVLGIANFRRGSPRAGPATIATAWSNAFDLPKHSISLGFRESQLVGREKMPIGGTRMRGASGNVPLGVVTGATDIFAHSNVMGTATGRIGMVVWDTNKMSYKDLNKTGAAYSGSRFRFRESITPTVLDAERMGLPFESEFMRDLKAKGSRVLTAEELKKPIYLGEQADGSPYFLRANPGDLGMTVKLQNAPNVSISKGQKPLLQLVVEADREVDMAKLFSVIHKGNVEFKNHQLLREYIGRDFEMKDVDKALGALGISSLEDLLVVNSNMVEKSWVAHEALMSQQAIAFSEGGLTVGKIREAVQKLDPKLQGLIAEMIGTHNMTPAVKASRTHLAKYAIATVTSMQGVDPAHLGNVLSGLYFGTTADDKFEAAALDKLLEFVFKGDVGAQAAAKQGMRFGASFVPDISAIGEQVFDWGSSTASMEPRAAVQLFERLKVAGVSTKDALKVVTKLHEGQSNFLPMFKIATGLNSVVQSMHGLYGPMDYVSDTADNITRLTLNQLKAGVVAADGDVIGFLKRFKKGSILDMGDAPDAVRSVFKEVFGGTEIRLPGAELFSAMKGTKVRVNASSPDIEIDNAVAVQLKSLTERLFGAGTDVQRLKIGLKDVRDEMDGLLVQSMSGLTKGKVRGSASPISKFFSLDDTSIHALEAKKLAWSRKIFRKTSGKLAFYDTDAFLSQIANNKGVLDLNRRASLAEAFFMGGEWTETGRARGVAAIAGRDPILTAGNFSMVDIFRHPDEIARFGGEDKFFKTFAESARGKKILSRYVTDSRAGSMQNFGDLLSALGTGRGSSTKRHRFFKEFVSHLSDFYDFDKSGTVSMPMFRVGDRDIGFSAAAYLDNDGDHLKTFMLSKEEQRIFRRAVGDQGYKQDDVLFRLFTQEMGAQSKQALKNIAAKLSGVATGVDAIDNEIKKGVTLAIRTGPLDVSLQRLHSAMFDYAGDNVDDAMFNQGVLGAVLETFALKSKKLPIATDYPQEFKLVTDALMDNPNEENAAAFKRLIGEAYEGTDFGGKGFTVDLSPVAQVDPRLAARLGNKSRTFSADSWTDYVIGAARSAYANGTNRSTSEGARRALLANNPEEFKRIFSGGADVASAAMRAFTDEADMAAKASYAGSAMRSNFLNLDRMATGQLALALGVGAVLSGIVGMSHSSAPMINPNEALPAASVRDAIAQNNLFTGGSDEIPRDYPSAEVGYSSQNIAYLERPNTYQIKGRVGSQGALQSISGDYRMMTGGAGRGSVVVNDRRTPITSNYIDRLLGEY